MALKIVCPFCGKEESREFQRSGGDVVHSIPCDECKLIDRGRMTLVDMCTAISVILGSNRPKVASEYYHAHRLYILHNHLKDAIAQIDLYIDEVPF